MNDDNVFVCLSVCLTPWMMYYYHQPESSVTRFWSIIVHTYLSTSPYLSIVIGIFSIIGHVRSGDRSCFPHLRYLHSARQGSRCEQYRPLEAGKWCGAPHCDNPIRGGQQYRGIVDAYILGTSMPGFGLADSMWSLVKCVPATTTPTWKSPITGKHTTFTVLKHQAIHQLPGVQPWGLLISLHQAPGNQHPGTR